MSTLTDVSIQEAYKEFCSLYPLKKLSMPKNDSVWSYYDINIKNDNVIIFLHGVCGTAGCFFYQMHFLSKLKYRIISLQYPCYNYISDWIKNLCNILEYLNVKKAHFFASDLGGYLIQLYAKLYPTKVSSLILCNAYRRTEDFAAVASLRNIYGKLYSFLPHIILKNIMLEDYIYASNYFNIDLKEKNALEFMSNELDIIPASDLGGRISLQLSSEIVDSIYVNDTAITLIQSFDNMLPEKINEDMRRAYPKAKHALMKSGGIFPYLSRHEEVNLYISVHLRNNCSVQFAKEQIHMMTKINKRGDSQSQQDSIASNVTNTEGERSSVESFYSGNRNKLYRDDRDDRDDSTTYYEKDDAYICKKRNDNNKFNTNSGGSTKNRNYEYQNMYRNELDNEKEYDEIAYQQNGNKHRNTQYYENESNIYNVNKHNNYNVHENSRYVNENFYDQHNDRGDIYNAQNSFMYTGSDYNSNDKINETIKGSMKEHDDENEDSEEEYINVIRNNAKKNTTHRFNQYVDPIENEENKKKESIQNYRSHFENNNPNDVLYQF